MSFWPFGQNVHSNINRILEEYFHILHALEKRDESGHVAENADLTPEEPEEVSDVQTSSMSSPESQNLTTQSLNSCYIDNILKESELLNELTRQNNTLLDFICFGYFYNGENAKVQNIEYLIDQLMKCIDNIDDAMDGNVIPLPPATGTDTQAIGLGNDETRDANNDFRDDYDDDTIVPNLDEDDSKQSPNLNKATIISEIFALDIWLISESVVKNVQYLNKMWSIMYHPHFSSEKSPLIPIFLKINQNLLATRQDQYLNFIRTRETLVQDMLSHIELSVLMDFFLKIISTDKQESPSGMIELVHEQKLIDRLLQHLDNDKYSPDIQACAGDFLKVLIAISANAPLDEMSIGPNSLTRHLASEPCVKYLLDAIVKKRGDALITAVSVVIELIRKNNSDYDQVNLLTTTLDSHPPSVRDPIYLGELLKVFSTGVPLLYQVLVDIEEDNTIPVIENQLGQKFKPLGFERFKVVELFAELLHCSNMGLLNSKKAERIMKERNECRVQVEAQLRDALSELEIQDDGTPKKNPTEMEGIDVEDLDETFEIPYVNADQNRKLRINPTIGDLFKIKLYDVEVLPKVVSLFLQYPWNNFWHNVIFDVIQQIFNGRMDFSYNSFLVYSLFNGEGSNKFMNDPRRLPNPFNITHNLILEGYRESYSFFEKYNTSLGFMGHLVLIAEEIVKFSKVYKVELISPDIQRALLDEDWTFYAEDVLNDTRIMYSKILGGTDYMEDDENSRQRKAPSESSEGMSSNGGSLINVNSIGNASEPEFSTQADLHQKLRQKLIERSRQEVDRKNKEKGVILLGMSPEDTAQTRPSINDHNDRVSGDEET
ncbi:LAMI_0D02212g1_1 [Lachancea mirantina]|uniref:LAMI_0D02212g1_1 n=1 Tax=Lachancea mirantina TaxID=1230905 RepID=A0A1G4J964_9SACH|nr:LAMI_0D02212g1_1 [Lachancea mirantina]